MSRCLLFLLLFVKIAYTDTLSTRIPHLLSAPTTIYSSAGFSNVTYPFLLVLNGQSSAGGECTNGVCYNPIDYRLSVGDTQFVDITVHGPNSFIELNYNICSGVTSDSSAQPVCDGYLDNLTIHFTESALTASLGVNPTGGVSVQRNPSVPYDGYYIQYWTNVAPIAPPTVYPSGILYRGINLSGGEFDSGFYLPGASEMIYFISKGMNITRIPFKWEYIQPNLDLPIDFSSGHALQIVDLINALVDAHVYVLLDMHNYMRYDGQVIGASSVTTTQYATAWGELAAQFHGSSPHNYSTYLFFDLMNEPHDMDTHLILTNYNAAIAAIRDQGANNLVLLEGNCWSCLGTWFTDCGNGSNATVFVPGNIIDPANNYALGPHQYLDASPCGSGYSNCLNPSSVLSDNNFTGFTDYLRTNNLRAFLGEINGIASSNCYDCINTYLTAVEENAYSEGNGGFIGWCAWSAGHAWPPTDPLNLTWFGSDAPQITEAFSLHLTAP